MRIECGVRFMSEGTPSRLTKCPLGFVGGREVFLSKFMGGVQTGVLPGLSGLPMLLMGRESKRWCPFGFNLVEIS